MSRSGIDDVLSTAVDRGVITDAQRTELLAIAASGPEPRVEAPAGFSGVGVAYTLGALLVMFACGWFLVNKWASLGGWGVMAVAMAYAAILVITGRRLRRAGFTRASGLAFMLAVSLAPIVAWSLLDLTGEWPRLPVRDAFFRYLPYMATRYLVLDLSTLLAALLTWRWRRFPELVIPIAIALWWTWFHLGQLIDLGAYVSDYQRWLMLAAGLALLATADLVDRWQRREKIIEREGDYATWFWYVGLLAFALGYMVLWFDAGRWKHLMSLAAIGLLVLSLLTGRRAIAFTGILGIFGYLGWLASDVFENTALFPVVLAALGILMILATVWLQRRLPALTTRLAASGTLPWPSIVSWLPVALAVAMAAGALRNGEERRLQRERDEREALMRRHREVHQGGTPTPPPR